MEGNKTIRNLDKLLRYTVIISIYSKCTFGVLAGCCFKHEASDEQYSIPVTIKQFTSKYSLHNDYTRKRIEIAWNHVCARAIIPCFYTDARCKINVSHCGKATVWQNIKHRNAYRVNNTSKRLTYLSHTHISRRVQIDKYVSVYIPAQLD